MVFAGMWVLSSQRCAALSRGICHCEGGSPQRTRNCSRSRRRAGRARRSSSSVSRSSCRGSFSYLSWVTVAGRPVSRWQPSTVVKWE
eukprot:1685120-Prymnesium_polylepis.1